ncbi:MAG: hypothetical protein ACYC1C_01910 [Chloroflexota bacterium]
MPVTPTSVAALLRGREGYLAFRRIVRDLFPAEEAAILGAGQPGVGRENARVWAFLHLVEERFFPVYELEEYDQVAAGIPFVREGWSYERFHDLDLPPGQLLLLCLCAHPYGPDFANRVPLLETCEAHVPRSLLEAIPTEGLSPDRLRERLEGTAFMGAADFADWVWGETGTAFLDLDDDAEVWDADWTPETVEELAGQWVRASTILDQVTELARWLEADAPAHFTALLDAALGRETPFDYERTRRLYAYEITQEGLVPVSRDEPEPIALPAGVAA